MKSQAFVAVTGMNNKVENRLVTIGNKTSELDGEANLTFDGSTLAITGNLSVTGTTTTLSTTNLVIKDQLIELGNGRSGSASGDAGIIVERGSDTNAAIIFDESEDLWKVCTTAATGASTGDLTLTDAALKAAAITSSGVVTATGFTIGSAVISEADLEQIDGITAGTVAASKAMVVDASLDISGARHVTISGELDAGSLDISGDADIDGTLEADAITVNGTALNTVIAGVTVTNATNATNATNSAHVLVTDNESTSEENLITFVEGGTSATGNVGLEMDGHLTYNPSSGTVTATVFKGNIDAVDGDFDGTLEADAITVGGTNISSIYSPIAGGSGIVTTGALDAGSITSNFGTINVGASTIDTTGAVGTGALTVAGDATVTGGDVTLGSASDANNASVTAVGESGTNTNGKTLLIGGGLGTGTGLPGAVEISSGIPTSSGSNAQSPTTIASFGTYGPTFNYGGVSNLVNDESVGDKVFFGTGQTVKGKLYYLDTNGAWVLADADAEVSTASLLAVACGGDGSGNANDAASNGMLVRGFIDNASAIDGTFDQGDPVYVSLTAGNMTFTRPSASGDFVRCIGFACATANVIMFAPDNTWLEL